MLQKTTLFFLKELKNNNNKPWFEKNRTRFELAKNDLKDLVQSLITGIGIFDPAITALKAKETTFRQNRDIRFSKDKRPYKNNMGAYINPGGKKINTPGYYLHIEPGKSMVAGGLYQPESMMLTKIRQEIDYTLDEWNNLLSEKNFKRFFPEGLSKENILKRPPKGYEIDNPAIEYLKLKSFTVSKHLSDEDICSPALKHHLLQVYKSMKPMLKFLQRAIE